MKDNIPTADCLTLSSEIAIHHSTLDGEETLVADSRASMTPSQLVEQKLIGRLKSSPLLVSQVQRRLKPGPR